MYKLGNNLKKLRTTNGLTQQDVAEILGLSRASYINKENGKFDFSQTEIEKLMLFFNLPYESIFFNNSAHKSCTA